MKPWRRGCYIRRTEYSGHAWKDAWDNVVEVQGFFLTAFVACRCRSVAFIFHGDAGVVEISMWLRPCVLFV